MIHRFTHHVNRKLRTKRKKDGRSFDMTRRKVYVTVNAEHKPDGSCRPKSIKLADRSEYPIDRILQVCPCASSVGGMGIRYTVRIGSSETCLYDEQNGRWFVEAKF